MGYLLRAVSRVGGRRVLLALGGMYVAVALGSPLLQVLEGRAFDDVLIIAILVGGAGLTLLYAGYRLPRTTIRPDLYGDIASWCVRAIEGMLAVLLLVEIVAGIGDIVANVLILTSLASVAGLGMGIHDGRAKTRALDAEEYSRELERYETIVETVNDGIFVSDEDNRFVLVNDAYCELVGYDREELIGSPTSLVADEEAESVTNIIDEVERNLTAESSETNTYETPLTTASGETITVEWSVAPLPEQDGGAPDRVVVVRDVTDRNERERELEQQNRRLESFASMLAHELRNPVNIGQIYSQQLPTDTDPEVVEYITEAFDRIEDMIDVILVLARGREAVGGSNSIRLAEVAREAWEDVNGPDATLEVDLGATIQADETYVRHLFGNLFKNAVQHGGADVTVTVGEVSTGFYVADDGSGIPAADQDTVFEAGYTTAGGRGGSGLGLAFVRELAEVYEWTCSVTESSTGGARFEFTDVTAMPHVTE